MIKDDGNTYLPAYDAMGNLHALMTVSAATINGTSYSAGDMVAAYDGAQQGGDGRIVRFARRADGETGWQYDAFGRTLRESGAYAADNPIRFSTRYTDNETDLVYYGKRYYSPSLGRFINRDPIEEQGGINLYTFVGNNAVNQWDYLGMDAFGAYEWYDSPSGGGYRFVETDGMTGEDFHDQAIATFASMAQSMHAELAMASALEGVDRAALAKVSAAIQSGQISRNGDSVTISGKDAQSLNAALSWTVGAVSSGGNAVASAVHAGAAAWVAQTQGRISNVYNSLAVASMSSGSANADEVSNSVSVSTSYTRDPTDGSFAGTPVVVGFVDAFANLPTVGYSKHEYNHEAYTSFMRGSPGRNVGHELMRGVGERVGDSYKLGYAVPYIAVAPVAVAELGGAVALNAVRAWRIGGPVIRADLAGMREIAYETAVLIRANSTAQVVGGNAAAFASNFIDGFPPTLPSPNHVYSSLSGLIANKIK